MKIFDRTPGYYLFWLSTVYLVVGFADVHYRFMPLEYLQIIWIACLAFPFTYPPFGRWLNMSINWDRKMFDKDKPSDKTDNVVPFPELKPVPPIPQVEPPSAEPAKIFYRIGVTDQDRISFSMGHMEITMNAEGIDNLIAQLELHKKILLSERENNV